MPDKTGVLTYIDPDGVTHVWRGVDPSRGVDTYWMDMPGGGQEKRTSIAVDMRDAEYTRIKPGQHDDQARAEVAEQEASDAGRKG